MSQPTNAEIVQAINRAQNCGYVHPLTCDEEKCRADLEAVERDGKVVLVCPKCGYIQTFVPSDIIAFGFYLAELEKLGLHHPP